MRSRGGEDQRGVPDEAGRQLARGEALDVTARVTEARDHAGANFVVNHVPDPRGAVRELARVTAPGGRVIVTIWPPGGNGSSALVAGAFADADVVPVPPSHLAEHLDFPRTVPGLASIVREAGLVVVGQREITWPWRVTAGALWTGIEAGIATSGETYLAQGPDVRARAKEAFFRRAGTLETEGVLTFPSRAVLVVGEQHPA